MTGYAGADSGRPALRERADRPLVRGPVEAGIAPLVAVAAEPAHPGNAVVLLTRAGGAPAQTARAVAEAVPSGDPAQWFSGQLPPLSPGDAMQYRVELVRCGQLVATLPADGTWLTVSGAPPATSPTRSPAPAARFALDLRFFATQSLTGRLEAIGETPDGYRINFLVEQGRIVGPGVDGVIRPGGADWLCIRRDGTAVIDSSATCELADGTVLFYRSGGLVDFGQDGYARAVSGTLGGNPPVYSTPAYTTADPRWRWLNRLQGTGVGQVAVAQSRVDYDVYLPRSADPPHA